MITGGNLVASERTWPMTFSCLRESGRAPYRRYRFSLGWGLLSLLLNYQCYCCLEEFPQQRKSVPMLFFATLKLILKCTEDTLLVEQHLGRQLRDSPCSLRVAFFNRCLFA